MAVKFMWARIAMEVSIATKYVFCVTTSEMKVSTCKRKQVSTT